MTVHSTMHLDYSVPTKDPNPGGGKFSLHDSPQCFPGSPYCAHDGQADISAYASSPNSLFMYEQERCDMMNIEGQFNQSTYGSEEMKCDESFDLKPQYECNNDALLYSGAFEAVTTTTSQMNNLQNSSVWTNTMPGLLKLDDVFQVDTQAAYQGPTLAELNLNEQSMFDDIKKETEDFDVSFSAPPQVDVKPTETLHNIHTLKSRELPHTQTMNLPVNFGSSAEKSMAVNALYHLHNVPKESKSSLHFLLSQDLKDKNPLVNPTAQTVRTLKRSSGPSLMEPKQAKIRKRTASETSLEEKWEEIRQFVDEDTKGTCSSHPAVKLEPKDENDQEDIVFNPKEEIESDNEVFESDKDDSDAEETSDNDSNFSVNTPPPEVLHEDRLSFLTTSKRPSYFWQYNVQSKGPKGERLCLPMDQPDPHVLNAFHDPVFDPGLKTQCRIKHGGSARKGDGNDILPRPGKLLHIGNELAKLNKTISDLTPVSELPPNIRTKSRREKNKLASRACRLKKKAQHEANKVKMHGLNEEHKQLMTVLSGIKREILTRARNQNGQNGEKLTVILDSLIKNNLTHMIAGHTSDYVSSVLEKMKKGVPNGGLKM